MISPLPFIKMILLNKFFDLFRFLGCFSITLIPIYKFITRHCNKNIEASLFIYLNGLVYYLTLTREGFFYPSSSDFGSSSGLFSQSSDLHGMLSSNPQEDIIKRDSKSILSIFKFKKNLTTNQFRSKPSLR